jgi:hypothetical protein
MLLQLLPRLRLLRLNNSFRFYPGRVLVPQVIKAAESFLYPFVILRFAQNDKRVCFFERLFGLRGWKRMLRHNR